MNKKLIAAAIAAVVAAPAAVAADTTLYGKAHVSIDKNDDNFGAGDNYTVSSNASRLGVKGSEDLGNGLKAIFKYEMSYDITDGGGVGGTARNSYVGLSGGFGTILAGRHDTPAKVAFYATGNDLIGDSIIDLNGIGFTEVRASNAIAYISPNFSGFTVAAAIVPGEQTGGTSTAGTTATAKTFGTTLTITGLPTGRAANNDGIADSYSLGLMYAGGGLKAGIGYEVLADGIQAASGTDDSKMWQVGASYTFGDFMVGANYENKDNDFSIDGLERTTWAIVAKATFGNNYVAANYGQVKWEHSAVASDLEGTTFGIGVGHKFSKRTQVYAAYRDQEGEFGSASADNNAFSLGMIHTF